MIPGDSGGVFIYVLSLILIWIIFTGLFHYFRPRAAEKRWFLQHGKRVTAVVEKIVPGAKMIRSGADYEYSVYARWRDRKTGRIYTVESDWVPLSYLKKSTNPSLSHDIAPGEPLQVLVDPNDPEHAMIAELPPKITRKTRIFYF